METTKKIQLNPGGMKTLGEKIWRNRAIYSLLLPGIIWYIVFAYFPMAGLSLAFKVYKASKGILGSPWVGFENYVYVFRDTAFLASIKTTLIINFGRMLFEFPVPIILALMLNELRMPRYRKFLQTVFTFPQFLSWVVVASILTNVLSLNGLVNSVIKCLGGSAFNFLGTPSIFQALLFITDNWKAAGWSAIIYLAAIAGIDTAQYEAAEIDGATRMQRISHITVPNIMPTIIVLFILSMGNLMSAGFDQIFNLSNAAVKGVSETLDMYIYRITFQAPPDFSFSMAVSLFRSAINMLLLIIADRGSKLMGGDGLFA